MEEGKDISEIKSIDIWVSFHHFFYERRISPASCKDITKKIKVVTKS